MMVENSGNNLMVNSRQKAKCLVENPSQIVQQRKQLTKELM
jgi:hypothetical protein